MCIRDRLVDPLEIVVTDGRHGGASPELDATRLAARRVLVPLLKRGLTPVVPGFFGAAPDGSVATLGRGGTDLTATLLARSLSAAEVVLWKDVTGILTADPRDVPGARVIPDLHRREAAEAAYFGAKVLHPRALIPLEGTRATLRVRSFLDPEQPGTSVTARRGDARYPVKALAPAHQQVGRARRQLAQRGDGPAHVEVLADRGVERGQQAPSRRRGQAQRIDHVPVAPQQRGRDLRARALVPRGGAGRAVEQQVGHAGERGCDQYQPTAVTGDERRRAAQPGGVGEGRPSELPDGRRGAAHRPRMACSTFTWCARVFSSMILRTAPYSSGGTRRRTVPRRPRGTTTRAISGISRKAMRAIFS